MNKQYNKYKSNMNTTNMNEFLDTLDQLTVYNYENLKLPLMVKFNGEEGVDAGGVQKEFFYLIIRQIFDPSYGKNWLFVFSYFSLFSLSLSLFLYLLPIYFSFF